MHSDERTGALGLDAVEIQLRRRVFWQLYVSDKYVGLVITLTSEHELFLACRC
jgi:hypothetical protein